MRLGYPLPPSSESSQGNSFQTNTNSIHVTRQMQAAPQGQGGVQRSYSFMDAGQRDGHTPRQQETASYDGKPRRFGAQMPPAEPPRGPMPTGVPAVAPGGGLLQSSAFPSLPTTPPAPSADPNQGTEAPHRTLTRASSGARIPYTSLPSWSGAAGAMGSAAAMAHAGTGAAAAGGPGVLAAAAASGALAHGWSRGPRRSSDPHPSAAVTAMLAQYSPRRVSELHGGGPPCVAAEGQPAQQQLHPVRHMPPQPHVRHSAVWAAASGHDVARLQHHRYLPPQQEYPLLEGPQHSPPHRQHEVQEQSQFQPRPPPHLLSHPPSSQHHPRHMPHQQTQLSLPLLQQQQQPSLPPLPPPLHKQDRQRSLPPFPPHQQHQDQHHRQPLPQQQEQHHQHHHQHQRPSGLWSGEPHNLPPEQQQQQEQQESQADQRQQPWHREHHSHGEYRLQLPPEDQPLGLNASGHGAAREEVQASSSTNKQQQHPQPHHRALAGPKHASPQRLHGNQPQHQQQQIPQQPQRHSQQQQHRLQQELLARRQSTQRPVPLRLSRDIVLPDRPRQNPRSGGPAARLELLLSAASPLKLARSKLEEEEASLRQLQSLLRPEQGFDWALTLPEVGAFG